MKIIKKLYLIFFVGVLTGQSIGFVGNSITADGYGTIVGNYLPQYKIYNFGVGGITVEGYKTTSRYTAILNTRPEITVILLGTNDWRYYTNRNDEWRENWHNEYQSLINTFNRWSDVFVGTIPYQVYSSEPDAAIENMNARIIGMQNKKGVIDFNYALGKNSDYFKDDGVHPNDSGKRVMAEAVWIYLANNQRNVDTTPPEPPKNLHAIAGNNKVTITWDSNTEDDLDKYFLFRGTEMGGATKGIKTFTKYYTSYMDTNVINDTTYYYQIAAGDLLDNRGKKSDQVSTTPSFLSIEKTITPSFKYINCFPNPFNPTTTISYFLERDSEIILRIYDISGKLISTLQNEHQTKGEHSINWDGINNTGVKVGGGVYFYQINAGNLIETGKMLLLK